MGGGSLNPPHHLQMADMPQQAQLVKQLARQENAKRGAETRRQKREAEGTVKGKAKAKGKGKGTAKGKGKGKNEEAAARSMGLLLVVELDEFHEESDALEDAVPCYGCVTPLRLALAPPNAPP